MIIGHYKRTPIANAPDAISGVINNYTEHESYVFGYGYGNTKVKPRTNIVHQHNVDIINFPRKIIQYHSEPFRVKLSTNIPKLVIAQYHATLPEYANLKIVRNPIDLFIPQFWPIYQDSKIKIGYSPSSKSTTGWGDKGYNETIPILNLIKKRFKDKVEVDIITNVSLNECLKRKSTCNIIIDEVKTDSYHRSGLEGLALGAVTICSVGPAVERIFLNAAKSDINPFINIYHDKLLITLTDLITSGLTNLLTLGYNNRLWMEKYWHPTDIANEYVEIYKKLI